MESSNGLLLFSVFVLALWSFMLVTSGRKTPRIECGVFRQLPKNQATQQNGDIFGSACGRNHIDWRAAISWKHHGLNFISGQRWCLMNRYWLATMRRTCSKHAKNNVYLIHALTQSMYHPYPKWCFLNKKHVSSLFFLHLCLEPTFKSPKPWTLFQPQAGTSIGIYLNVHYIAIVYYTLPETNSSHLIIGHPIGNVFKSSKSSFVCRCYGSFRGV